MNITQIVAVDKYSMIARDDFNGILWKCNSDMKRFKKETTGHNIIMGRTTFESIGNPLPNRNNIILTRNMAWPAPKDTHVVHNIASALACCEPDNEIFIIGGAQIYSLFESITTEIHFTKINIDANGNVPYPIDLSRFDSYQREYFEKKEKDDADQIVIRYRIKNCV